MKKWDVWFYEKEDLEADGIELDPPDDQEAGQNPTLAATIEEAVAATIQHDIAHQRKRIDLLRRADVNRSYCIAVREHGSTQPWKLFKGAARVIVVVDQVEDVSRDMAKVAPWASEPMAPPEVVDTPAAVSDFQRSHLNDSKAA